MIEIEGKVLYIFVKSSRQSISISERSNGLKWYVNLFLQIKAKNIQNKSIIFLIDEPGVHLHIDAQQHLIRLFHDLSTENQIIYTTHSPFMIETDYLERLRPIIKENGISKVLNSIHDKNLSDVSNQETLSPISQSMGISMASNFSVYGAPFSIITEGKLDEKYLCAFDYTLKKDFKFISCMGAQNIINISMILSSWKCDFIILLDYDEEGRNVKEKLLKKTFLNILLFL